MKKIFKRIAAMSAAVMMMASISSMGVSAAFPNHSSAQQNSRSWKLTTSVSKANCNVNARGTGYYYKNIGRETASTGNGNSSNTSGVTCYLTNRVGYGLSHCISTHEATGYTPYTYTVQGYFVNV